MTTEQSPSDMGAGAVDECWGRARAPNGQGDVERAARCGRAIALRDGGMNMIGKFTASGPRLVVLGGEGVCSDVELGNADNDIVAWARLFLHNQSELQVRQTEHLYRSARAQALTCWSSLFLNRIQ